MSGDIKIMMMLRSDHEKVIDEAFGFKGHRFRDLTRIERFCAFALLALILASMLQEPLGDREAILVDSASTPAPDHQAK